MTDPEQTPERVRSIRVTEPPPAMSTPKGQEQDAAGTAVDPRVTSGIERVGAPSESMAVLGRSGAGGGRRRTPGLVFRQSPGGVTRPDREGVSAESRRRRVLSRTGDSPGRQSTETGQTGLSETPARSDGPGTAVGGMPTAGHHPLAVLLSTPPRGDDTEGDPAGQRGGQTRPQTGTAHREPELRYSSGQTPTPTDRPGPAGEAPPPGADTGTAGVRGTDTAGVPDTGTAGSTAERTDTTSPSEAGSVPVADTTGVSDTSTVVPERVSAVDRQETTVGRVEGSTADDPGTGTGRTRVERTVERRRLGGGFDPGTHTGVGRAGPGVTNPAGAVDTGTEGASRPGEGVGSGRPVSATSPGEGPPLTLTRPPGRASQSVPGVESRQTDRSGSDIGTGQAGQSGSSTERRQTGRDRVVRGSDAESRLAESGFTHLSPLEPVVDRQRGTPQTTVEAATPAEDSPHGVGGRSPDATAAVDDSQTGPGEGESTTAAGSAAGGETAPGVAGRVPGQSDDSERRGGRSEGVFPPFSYLSKGVADRGEQKRSPGGPVERGAPARTSGVTAVGRTAVSTETTEGGEPGATPEPGVVTVQRRSSTRSRSGGHGAVGPDREATFTHLSPGPEPTHGPPSERDPEGRSADARGQTPAPVTGSPGRLTDPVTVVGTERSGPAGPVDTSAATSVGGSTRSAPTDAVPPQSAGGSSPSGSAATGRDTGPTFTHLLSSGRVPAADSTDQIDGAPPGEDTARSVEAGPAMTVTDTGRAGVDARDGADRQPTQSSAFTHLSPAPPVSSGRAQSTGRRSSGGVAAAWSGPDRSSTGDRSVRRATDRQDRTAGTGGGPADPGAPMSATGPNGVALVTRSTAGATARAGRDRSDTTASAESVTTRPAEMTLLSESRETDTDGTGSGEDLTGPGTQNSATPADSMPPLTLQSTGAGGDRPGGTRQASAGAESAERERDRSRGRESAGDETGQKRGPRDHTRRVGESLEPGGRGDQAGRERPDRQREERVESDLTMNSPAPQVDATTRGGGPRDITYRERESTGAGRKQESVDAESLLRAVERDGRPPAGLDQVVERLYREIERRRRIERERRGL